MNPYFNEVIDAHIAIERWLGKGAGEEQALLARFTPDFSMIALNGARWISPRCALFRAHRAAKPGLEIEIEEMKLVAEWPTGAVVSYREKQRLPGQSATLRYSTVVFERLPDALGWRHLHETAAAQ